jgi:Holliday junction resolvasome RuvABC DNA-binding subunit
MTMTSINPLQSNSALLQLLANQQPAQATAAQPAQASASQSSATDSLSLSNAALQALQGLGLDSAQLQQAQTYTAKSHQHHHHHGAAQSQQGTSAQLEGASASTQVSQVGPAESALLQAKS